MADNNCLPPFLYKFSYIKYHYIKNIFSKADTLYKSLIVYQNNKIC